MRVVLVTLAVVLLPLAAAQGHEHANENGVAMVLHDGPDGGRAVVGAWTHFGFALLDKGAAPTPHQNAEFVVTQNGGVLFSTADTHEYDGLFSFDVRFTKPGPYQVVATSGEMGMGSFSGEAILPVNATAATIELDVVPAGPASRVVGFELRILDAAGEILPHTDAIVDFRDARDGALAARHHLHIHDAPIAFSQGFGAGTEYVAQVIGYQAFNSGRMPDVPAVVASFPVSVGPVGAPAAPAPDLAPPALLEQVGPVAEADGLRLHLMFDPNQQVGVGQVARISGVLVETANHSTKAHADFAMTLSGPRGLVFASDSGHEYDGVFEYLFVPGVPGAYDGTLRATYDATELTVPIHLLVVPPAVPLVGGTGLVSVAVDGLDALVAGAEAELTFSASSAAGPAKHSEVDVTIFHDDEPPLYRFKLHTHDSGLTNAVVQFPHAGPWQMRIDALPTLPEASLYMPTLLSFEVGEGDAAAPLPVGAAVEQPDARVPGAWLLVSVIALGCAAGLRRP